MNKKDIWDRLGKVALENKQLTDAERELMNVIVDNIVKYQRLLDDIASGGVIDDSKNVLINLKRKEVLEQVKSVALKDKVVTDDEKKLVNATVQMIKELETDMKSKLKKRVEV